MGVFEYVPVGVVTVDAANRLFGRDGMSEFVSAGLPTFYNIGKNKKNPSGSDNATRSSCFWRGVSGATERIAAESALRETLNKYSDFH
jgi:hypothetical protein